MQSRTFKVGGLYLLKSKREGSSFKAVIRVCRNQNEENFHTTIFFEDFLTGSLVRSTAYHRSVTTTEVEMEDPWVDMNVEYLGNDIVNLIRYKYAIIADLLTV